MKISIFGMGYVGAVSGICLAELGHEVVGVDINASKVDLINAGRAPIVESGIAERIKAAQADGRMRATTDPAAAVAGTEVSMISVGTPSTPHGTSSLTALDAVVGQIAEAIGNKGTPHTVVMRSTVPPGTTEDRLIPALVAGSGQRLRRLDSTCPALQSTSLPLVSSSGAPASGCRQRGAR